MTHHPPSPRLRPIRPILSLFAAVALSPVGHANPILTILEATPTEFDIGAADGITPSPCSALAPDSALCHVSIASLAGILRAVPSTRQESWLEPEPGGLANVLSFADVFNGLAGIVVTSDAPPVPPLLLDRSEAPLTYTPQGPGAPYTLSVVFYDLAARIEAPASIEVPEPATLTLLGLGLAGMKLVSRRRVNTKG